MVLEYRNLHDWVIFGVNVGVHIPYMEDMGHSARRRGLGGSIWGFFYPQTIGIEQPDLCIFGAHQDWSLQYNLLCTTVPPKEMNDRMILNDTEWYWMILNDIELYCMVFNDIEWYWMITSLYIPGPHRLRRLHRLHRLHQKRANIGCP